MKTSTSAGGPGPCAQDRLHLQVRPVAGKWTCAEIPVEVVVESFAFAP